MTARPISSALGIPHVEPDSVFHRPGWTEQPTDEPKDAARAFTDRDASVVGGSCTTQGIIDLVGPRAETVVWLDLCRAQMMRRIVAGTFRRISGGEHLWNESEEGRLNVVNLRPRQHHHPLDLDPPLQGANRIRCSIHRSSMVRPDPRETVITGRG